MSTSPLPHNSPATNKSSGNVGSSEVCPSCGHFTDERGLSEFTGWCYACTEHITSTVNVTSSGKAVELALAANVVAVQHYVSQGQSVWKALDSARLDRPKCVVCGETIRRSKRTAIFCRRHPLCRRYSRRYVYLYTERSMSKAEALASILTELTGGE